MKPSKLVVNLKVKIKPYFYFKLNLLSFLSNWFDVTQWQLNFMNDIHDNFSRYFKVYREPPEIIEKGGDQNLSDSE